MLHKKLLFSALITAGGLITANAAGVGALGILDTSGTNPATSAEWAPGDTYHLIYVTTNTTDALATDIADYNSFIQSDASAEGMGGVSWFALGSTTSTDAVNNAVITAPVINAFDSQTVAVDATDMWDFDFPTDLLNMAGDPKNVWTGTDAGGTASADNELGAANGTSRRHWSAWDSWGPAFATQANDEQREMVGISQELTVVPEPAATSLALLGGLALLRRRRR